MQRLGALLFAIGVGSAHRRLVDQQPGAIVRVPLVLGSALVLVGHRDRCRSRRARLFAVFVVAAFLTGMFVAPILVLSETVLQEGTRLEHRARVFSARDFLMRLTLLALRVRHGVVRGCDERQPLACCFARSC